MKAWGGEVGTVLPPPVVGGDKDEAELEELGAAVVVTVAWVVEGSVEAGLGEDAATDEYTAPVTAVVVVKACEESRGDGWPVTGKVVDKVARDGALDTASLVLSLAAYVDALRDVQASLSDVCDAWRVVREGDPVTPVVKAGELPAPHTWK